MKRAKTNILSQNRSFVKGRVYEEDQIVGLDPNDFENVEAEEEVKSEEVVNEEEVVEDEVVEKPKRKTKKTK